MPPKRIAGAKRKPVKALARHDTPMSDITNLWCYIEGDKNPFLVTVSLSILIDELKDKILEEENTYLQGVDGLSDLTLWKVRYI
jgi:hypothetical protein